MAEKNGFTLVEILVTLAIFSGCAPRAAERLCFRCRATQALSDNSSTALYLLKFRMAEIEMSGYPGCRSGDRANSVKTPDTVGSLQLKI